MLLEEEIRLYKELSQKIAELEQQKKELGLLILEQMIEKTMTVEEYVVRRYDRLSFKTSLEEARVLSATKIEEVIDKDKLKELHQAGQMIPGTSSSQFIQVSLKKESLVVDKELSL